jgi:hypothetical protein
LYYQSGTRDPNSIVNQLYTDVAPTMHGMGERCVEDHLQKLREDIDVPPQVRERWQRLALRDPMYQGMVQRALAYRKHVLAIFDSLVFREMKVHTRIQ